MVEQAHRLSKEGVLRSSTRIPAIHQRFTRMYNQCIQERNVNKNNMEMPEACPGGTKEYCLAYTLVVRNAFNSASWRSILYALRSRGKSQYLIQTLRSYFTDRVLLYDTADGVK
ncbi:GL16230 [Drosophila persimilis]|uniref:GL16230 n=1 Tax=Drosophila persimilis TaxID=7234 RepID=B4HBJ5_DROPE|nr:GL16230 [Drosophila persimilis]